jgi:PAS domain S-box-containing protein
VTTPLRCLLVEDSEDDALLVLRHLREGGFDPAHRRIQTAAELKTALAQERWDAVISDFKMPGFTGMDALRIFRSAGLDIPFILISGTIGEETAVDAMKAGASDYVMKKSLARLAPALERELKETQMRAAHRRAQEALTDSEKRFRQMAENIRDVFFLIDAASNRVLYVSPAYEEIWGCNCESVYANPEAWTDAIHPDDRASTYEKYKEGSSTGKFAYDYRIVRPDDSIRWIEARGFPVRDDAGKFVRIAGIAEDITERKQAAQELRESERRFSDLLGNVEMASLMLGTNARITYCNDYFLRLTGWGREEVIGRDWFKQFIPPEINDLKDVNAALLANKPEARHHENEILTRSGERRLIRWNNTVLRSGAGDVIGTASIGEDITERRMADEVLKKRAAELERFHRLSVGRELQMIELKKQINELTKQAGQKAPYDLAFLSPEPVRTNSGHEKTS